MPSSSDQTATSTLISLAAATLAAPCLSPFSSSGAFSGWLSAVPGFVTSDFVVRSGHFPELLSPFKLSKVTSNKTSKFFRSLGQWWHMWKHVHSSCPLANSGPPWALPTLKELWWSVSLHSSTTILAAVAEDRHQAVKEPLVRTLISQISVFQFNLRF